MSSKEKMYFKLCQTTWEHNHMCIDHMEAPQHVYDTSNKMDVDNSMDQTVLTWPFFSLPTLT